MTAALPVWLDVIVALYALAGLLWLAFCAVFVYVCAKEVLGVGRKTPDGPGGT